MRSEVLDIRFYYQSIILFPKNCSPFFNYTSSFLINKSILWISSCDIRSDIISIELEFELDYGTYDDSILWQNQS